MEMYVGANQKYLYVFCLVHSLKHQYAMETSPKVYGFKMCCQRNLNLSPPTTSLYLLLILTMTQYLAPDGPSPSRQPPGLGGKDPALVEDMGADFSPTRGNFLEEGGKSPGSGAKYNHVPPPGSNHVKRNLPKVKAKNENGFHENLSSRSPTHLPEVQEFSGTT